MDPEIFKKEGSDIEKQKKKNAKRSIRCMFRGTMFSFFILAFGTIFSLGIGGMIYV